MTVIAYASVTVLKYPKALAAVVAGNLVAIKIITLLCWFFSDYIDWIILAIGIIAVIVVAALIIKIILHKSPEQSAETDQNEEEK